MNDQTDIERLLALAGPRDAVPAERLQRMRAAVRDAWIDETKPRAQRRVAWALVIAAAAAAAVIATVRMFPEARLVKHADATAANAAARIETGLAERRSLPLPGGGELRIDVSSVVTIATNGDIEIAKGALYLDSKGGALPVVFTPAGRITDLGTRFEVRIVDQATRVRVREGRVRLSQASAVIEVGAAEELMARRDASLESMTRRYVAPFGVEWAWVARAAAPFELGGKSLGSFLDWIEQEGGWTVVFASSALERRARSTMLYGRIESRSTTEALDVILPACGLVHRVDLKTGLVTVSADGEYRP